MRQQSPCIISLAQYSVNLSRTKVTNIKFQGVLITEDKNITSLLAENIRLFEKIVIKTDELNKRLVTAVIVAMVVFSFTLIGICYFYFYADYGYPDVTQENNQEVNQDVKINDAGGD